MSILSKLFGGEKAEKKAVEFLKGLVNGSQPAQTQSRPAASAPVSNPRPYPASESPSGFSWGERMPAEENQFSFSGPYFDYFESIFRNDFPSYRLERSMPDSSSTVFTLWAEDRKALVVELLSDRSSRQKLRRQCRSDSVPYLRFYHDHPGWWNTRSYVVTRTRNALGL